MKVYNYNNDDWNPKENISVHRHNYLPSLYYRHNAWHSEMIKFLQQMRTKRIKGSRATLAFISLVQSWCKAKIIYKKYGIYDAQKSYNYS